MDEKKQMLIELVCNEPCIWDQKSEEYSKKTKVEKNQIWTQIGNIIDIEAESAKKMWNSLRDGFRRELKSCPKTKSGMAACEHHTTTWVYWKSLDFLAPTLWPRQTEGNLNLIQEMVLEKEINEENFNSSFNSESEIFKENRKRVCKLNLEQERLKILKTRVTRKEEEYDTDWLFLKSLMPDVRKINDKIKFRLALLQFMQNYLTFENDN